MKLVNGGPKQVRANFAFSALLFSVLGWALFETQLFNLAAGVRLHLVTSACGFAICAIAFRRCRVSWFSFVEVNAAIEHPAQNRYQAGASCIALFAAGCVLTLCATPESIALFAICACAFNSIPWSRIAFCRRHFFISCTMLGAGAASVLLILSANKNPFSYLICAWFLWLIAVADLLFAALKPDELPTPRPEAAPSAEARISKHVSGIKPENLVKH